MFDSTGLILETIIAAANFIARFVRDASSFTVAELAKGQQIIQDLLERSLGDLVEAVDLHDGDVLAAISDESDTLAQVVNSSEGRLKDLIFASFLDTQQATERSTSTILDTLGGSIAGAVEILTGQSDRAVGEILGGLQDQRSVLGNLSGLVQDEFLTLGSVVEAVVDLLGEGLFATIQNTVTIDETIFGRVLETVTESVRASQEANAGVIETITNVLGAIITETLDTVGEQLGELHPELRKVWQTIRDVGEKQIEIAETVLDPGPEGTGGRVTRSVIEQVSPGLERSAEALQRSFVDFIQRTGRECFTEQQRLELTEVPSGLDKIGASIFLWIAHMGSAIFKLLGIAQAESLKTVFLWQSCNPNQPLPPAETVLAWQRGLIDDATAQSNLQQQGWTADDAERVINVGFTAPDLSLSYAAWLRDKIDDEAFESLLSMQGYAKSFHPVLKELAFFIPPVQDLITMAVREVFTPEIAEAQGQFEDFPEDFARFAKQQGISEEWALNYWAAHWSLPSVQMGFEMLHRGVIDQPQLETLMRALDIMPGWREPLTKISFTPFTRVDIRRMHRLGVLSESDVLRAYKDIGYDDEKAAIQLEFVLAANQEDELVTLDVASDLTRSSILGFYSDGIIPRAAAFGLLAQAGINVAAAELFLLGADFDIERRDRKGQVDLILDRFRFAGLALTESADQIMALGLESRERDLALLDLERLSQQETKLPSKADLDKFLGAGIIGNAEYLDQLERQGFPVVWADRYLQLETGG